VGENGGLTLDKDFFVEFPKGYRSHQIRLEGGDCSTDSFCYPQRLTDGGMVDRTAAGLWLAVLLSGIYHGVNPGMGWPLAVSAALMEPRARPPAERAGPRAGGAVAGPFPGAMLGILLPFTLMLVLVE
jgi:hypothetical protein